MAKFGGLTKEQAHDPVIGGLIGLAVGDAFGVPVEFMSREEVQKINLQDMIGCDSDNPLESRWGDVIPAGAWSDDTSMTIATVASLIKNKGEIDYDDIMDQFHAWWAHGRYCSLEFPFGLGRCVSRALDRYWKGYPALRCGGERIKDNGNGSLMRMFPFAILCAEKGWDLQKVSSVISEASAITHAHDISKLSCFLYTMFLMKLIETKNPQEAYRFVCACGNIEGFKEDLRQIFSDLSVSACMAIFNINPDEIEESGYVVNSLKVAIYSIVNTNGFEDAVKMAVSFGYDTDTNAAIVGSLAGALYGYEDIPKRWLDKLKRLSYLEDMAIKFSKVLKGGN